MFDFIFWLIYLTMLGAVFAISAREFLYHITRYNKCGISITTFALTAITTMISTVKALSEVL